MTADKFVRQRYMHWSSAMRHEMLEAIKKAEQDIQRKHFDPENRKRQKESQIEQSRSHTTNT